MTEHRCTYDSHYGYIPGHAHLALMCGACGSWGMPGGGEWHTVPTELLPSACTHLSRNSVGTRSEEHTSELQSR